MKTIKAYQIPPEAQDNALVWHELTDDDGRLWSVCTDWGERKAEHDKPDGWTDDFYLAYKTLKAWYNDDSTDEWLNNDVVYLHSYATQAEECGVRDRPQLDEAKAAARKVIKAYSEGCDKGNATGRWPNDVEFAAALLSAVTGIEYAVHEIRGCCQGDWAQLVIPKAEEDAKAEIEAKYFNTGDAWKLVGDNGEVYHAYTWIWNGEDRQLREVAKDYFGSDIEVKRYAFDGYIKTPRYREVAA